MTMAAPAEDRLGRELEHFDGVAARDTETILSWNSPVGRARADRRGRLFVATRRIAPGSSSCPAPRRPARVLGAQSDEPAGAAHVQVRSAEGPLRGLARRDGVHA